jgi:hypothetical protein
MIEQIGLRATPNCVNVAADKIFDEGSGHDDPLAERAI